MKNPTTRPYAETRQAAYLQKRILELRPRKTQIEIAGEAGFRQAHMLAMIKNGSAKLPLDRVPALAKALDCDPRRLFQLALEQLGDTTTTSAIAQIFSGGVLTANERDWVELLRSVSDHRDPPLTTKSARDLRAIFDK